MSYLSELLERMVAVEKKALAPFTTVDAKPFSLWWQETFPYFTNRLAEELPEDIAADHQRRVYTVRGRLVTAHYTGRLDPHGSAEMRLYDYIPAIDDAFHGNYWLDPDDGETQPNGEGTIEELGPLSVQYTRCGGVQIFVNTALPGSPAQLGTEFAVTATFDINDIDDDEA